MAEPLCFVLLGAPRDSVLVWRQTGLRKTKEWQFRRRDPVAASAAITQVLCIFQASRKELPLVWLTPGSNNIISFPLQQLIADRSKNLTRSSHSYMCIILDDMSWLGAPCDSCALFVERSRLGGGERRPEKRTARCQRCHHRVELAPLPSRGRRPLARHSALQPIHQGRMRTTREYFAVQRSG